MELMFIDGIVAAVIGVMDELLCNVWQWWVSVARDG